MWSPRPYGQLVGRRCVGRDDLIAPNNDNPSGASRHLPLHKGGFGTVHSGKCLRSPAGRRGRRPLRIGHGPFRSLGGRGRAPPLRIFDAPSARTGVGILGGSFVILQKIHTSLLTILTKMVECSQANIPDNFIPYQEWRRERPDEATATCFSRCQIRR